MRLPAIVVLVALAAGCAGNAPPAPADGAPAALAWTELPGASTPRTEVAVAAFAGAIFAIGGFEDGLPEEVSLAAGASRLVEAFDVEAGAWSRRADYPVPVHHTAAVATEEALFVLGGYSVGIVPSTLAFRYDGRAWAPITPLPQARAAHAAALVGDVIYVAGGVGDDLDLAASVLAYNVTTDAWSVATELPTPRDHLAAAALDGTLYVASGQRLSHADTLPVLEAWNPATDAWETLAELPTPRNSVAGAAFGGRIVVAGGQDAERTFADVEAFDPVTRAWTALPPMPTARHGFGLAVAGDALYAALGGPEPGLSATGALEALQYT